LGNGLAGTRATADRTAAGAGVCVGRRFDSIDWRVVRITDEPIATIDQTEELPQGEIGELIVRGPQVSRRYLPDESAASDAADHNALAKIADGARVWHRLGDVGYFDAEQRFWYCGRKSHRVVTADGTLFTDDEMIRMGAGSKTGRRMGHMPISGEGGSLSAFNGDAKRVFLHINNTNPILIDGSPENLSVKQAGWDVGYDGMEFAL